MKFISKIKKKNIIILILLIVEFFSLILTYKSFNNKNLELNNSVESENRNFAMYLQDENGDYYLSKKTYFPSDFNYQLNKLLSECVDAKGQIIDTDYSFLNGKMIVSSDKTVYCNFYFDLIKDLYQTIATNGHYREYRGIGYYHDENDYDTINPYFTRPIYYYDRYYNNNDSGSAYENNWNVIFGGFCWYLIRTTNDGGVKLLYNGEATASNNADGTIKYTCGAPKSPKHTKHFGDGNMLYLYTDRNNPYTYYAGTDYTYENGKYKLAGDIVGATVSPLWEHYDNLSLLEGKYTCGSTNPDATCSTLYYVLADWGYESGYFYNEYHMKFRALPTTSAAGQYSIVNGYPFNEKIAIGYEGYMHNEPIDWSNPTYYRRMKLYDTESVSIPYVTYSCSDNVALFSDTYSFDGTYYSLTGNTQTGQEIYESNGNNCSALVGKYTQGLSSNENPSTSLMYVYYTSGNTMYVVQQSDGTDPQLLSYYVIGTSLRDNGNGTYSLLNTSMYSNTNFPSLSYSNSETRYFMCDDRISTTCSYENMTVLSSASSPYNSVHVIKLDDEINNIGSYTFSSNITNNGNGTYTLNNPTTIFPLSYYAKSFEDPGYLCLTGGNTCAEENLYYLYGKEGSNYFGINNINDVFYFSNTITYDETTGKYTLDMTDPNAKALKLKDIYLDQNRLHNELANAHYTCFGRSGTWSFNGGSGPYSELLPNTTTCEKLIFVSMSGLNNSSSTNKVFAGIVLDDGEYVSIDETSTSGMTKFADEKNVLYNAYYINSKDSTAKYFVDLWYRDNLLKNYDEYMDYDAVFCGDKSIDLEKSAFNPNRPLEYYTYMDEVDHPKQYATYQIPKYDVNTYDVYNQMNYEYDYYTSSGSYSYSYQYHLFDYNISCYHKPSAYSANETEFGNGDLKYPIALVSDNELRNIGLRNTISNSSSSHYYAATITMNNARYKYNFWTMSPTSNERIISYICLSNGECSPAVGDYDYYTYDASPYYTASGQSARNDGYRPMIALKPGLSVIRGDGSSANPYVINAGRRIILMDNADYYTNLELADSGDVITIYPKNKDTVLNEVTSFFLNGEVMTGNTFTMPDEDVAITGINDNQVRYEITCDECSSLGVVVPDPQLIGAEVTLTQSDKYVVESFEVNGTPITGNTFTMPEEDVVITNVQLTNYILVESSHPIETTSLSRYPYTKTFEGATSITVKLTYQMYSSSTSSNYIRVYQGSSSSSSTFGTYASSSIYTRTITVPGNYISFYWYDGYYTNHYSYYGYRIEITPNYS